MKVTGNSPPPRFSSVGSTNTTAHTAAPAQVAPQAKAEHPPAPSGPSENSHFDTKKEASAPSTLSRTPTPQEQAAYSKRAGSLGYGKAAQQREYKQDAHLGRPSEGGHASSSRRSRGSSSPRRAQLDAPFGVSDRTAELCNRIMDGAPQSMLIQHIDQRQFEGAGQGVCSAMAREWVKSELRHSDTREASLSFNKLLKKNPKKLIESQEAEAQLVQKSNKRVIKYQELSNELQAIGNALDNAEAELDETKQKLDRAMIRRDGRRIDELEDRAYELEDFLSKAEADYEAVKEERDGVEQRLIAAKAALASHRNGGRNLVGSAGGKVPESMHDFCKEVARTTQGQGVYRLHLEIPGRSGHVIGIAHLPDGSFKLMDPNTGEFRVSGSDMSKLLEGHMTAKYSGYTDYSVLKFE